VSGGLFKGGQCGEKGGGSDGSALHGGRKGGLVRCTEEEGGSDARDDSGPEPTGVGDTAALAGCGQGRGGGGGVW
jgi:hypothetical protein